ncbi:MAG: 16S rRNA (guanine(527)-N(7))-methyltransferase RsmG [Bacteroidota bacterium]|nr:16S rRNA (guanine(527)-N(7))-methyltransferase RsmG [Bacteroidota bacterium]MDX5430032.1 16S rRNA (guanine(527)-N(7))-methyltransferase RsmG [Bacteroidota bacterium]MDX5468802.1 16S rRNA (guanine(527)-N(7))-methyltransferase RsmG [Bacteroidota bacterium]
MQLLEKYFPELLEDEVQRKRFEQLDELYREWNQKINVISRKDMDGLYEKHVLHSLAIHRYQSIPEGAHLLDIGTGGGFPGIPMAIANPQASFHLVDSIGKKITVVKAVSEGLGLDNVKSSHERAEKIKESFDFILSRAVAPLVELVSWTHRRLKPMGKGAIPGKYLLLKGGDLTEEIAQFLDEFPQWQVKETPLSTWYEEPFFETKKILEVTPVGKN